MLVFNSIQIVSIFAAAPFLIQWLMSSKYQYASLLGWVASVGYLALFVWLITLVVMALDGEEARRR